MTSLGSLLLVGWGLAVGIVEGKGSGSGSNHAVILIEGEARVLPPNLITTPDFLDVAGAHISPSVVATPDFLDVAGAHGWIQLGNKRTFFLNGCIRPLVILAQFEPVFHQSFEFDLREAHVILRVLIQALNPSIGECDLELTCFGVL